MQKLILPRAWREVLCILCFVLRGTWYLPSLMHQECLVQVAAWVQVSPTQEGTFCGPCGPLSAAFHSWGCLGLLACGQKRGANSKPSSLPHQILVPSLSPHFGSPSSAHVTEDLSGEEELDFVCIAPSLKSSLWKISERTVLAEHKDTVSNGTAQ